MDHGVDATVYFEPMEIKLLVASFHLCVNGHFWSQINVELESLEIRSFLRSDALLSSNQQHRNHKIY